MKQLTYKSKNQLLQSIIQKIALTDVIFTGRVSFEAWGVLEPSSFDPKDIDIIVDNDLQLLALKAISIVDTVEILSDGNIITTNNLKISDVPIDIFKESYNKYGNSDIKTFNVDGTQARILHPKFAVLAKLDYLIQGVKAINPDMCSLDSKVSLRLKKHINHIQNFFDFYTTH